MAKSMQAPHFTISRHASPRGGFLFHAGHDSRNRPCARAFRSHCLIHRKRESRHRGSLKAIVSQREVLTRNGNSGSNGGMKTKTTGLIVALGFFAAAAVSFADDPQMGTWKLNEAKSKLAPGAPKNHTVVYETAGDNVKITVDGTDKDGNSTHNEWTGKFDGKDYPVTGDPTSDMRSYQKVGDRLLKMTIKKDGKVTVTGRIIVSADGKSRMVSTSEAGAKGKGSTNKTVYDKQ